MNAQDEINELGRQLQLKATGEHVHTINKAGYYLKIVSKRSPEDPARIKMIDLIKKALTINDWSELKHHMSRWW